MLRVETWRFSVAELSSRISVEYGIYVALEFSWNSVVCFVVIFPTQCFRGSRPNPFLMKESRVLCSRIITDPYTKGKSLCEGALYLHLVPENRHGKEIVCSRCGKKYGPFLKPSKAGVLLDIARKIVGRS